MLKYIINEYLQHNQNIHLYTKMPAVIKQCIDQQVILKTKDSKDQEPVEVK